MMDPKKFIRPIGAIVCIPNKKNPKLVLPNLTSKQKWVDSSFFPAFKVKAKIRRFLLRCVTLLRLKNLGHHSVPYYEFDQLIAKHFLSELRTQVLIGTQGETQKLIVKIKSKEETLAFFKFTNLIMAKESLKNEKEILEMLPVGVCPNVLDEFETSSSYGILIEAVEGKMMSAKLEHIDLMKNMLDSLVDNKEHYCIMNHPWVKRVELDGNIIDYLRVLENRTWPNAFLHGDLTPWNILVNEYNECKAIDWEYGNKYGLPYLDLVHYCLQVLFLLKSYSSEKAFSRTCEALMDFNDHNLTENEICAFVRIGAFNSFINSAKYGMPKDSPLQVWRRKIFTKSISN